MIMLSNKFHPVFNELNIELSKIIFNPGYKPEIPNTDNAANRDLTERVIKTIEASGLEQAKTVYKKRNKCEELLEFLMRNEGFNYIDDNKPGIAMQIFEMNVFVYPHSAKALQGLGEGYMETGNKEQAIRYFKKSLDINLYNSFVITKMKELQ